MNVFGAPQALNNTKSDAVYAAIASIAVCSPKMRMTVQNAEITCQRNCKDQMNGVLYDLNDSVL